MKYSIKSKESWQNTFSNVVIILFRLIKIQNKDNDMFSKKVQNSAFVNKHF